MPVYHRSRVYGRHFELVGSDGALYVLLPQTEEARVQLEGLEHAAAGGVKATVVGMMSNQPNAYMRGTIMKVISASTAK